jgi:glucose uptake protein GlcU
VAVSAEGASASEGCAQRVCAAVLQETYLVFASWTATVAVVLGVLALLFSLAGK